MAAEATQKKGAPKKGSAKKAVVKSVRDFLVSKIREFSPSFKPQPRSTGKSLIPDLRQYLATLESEEFKCKKTETPTEKELRNLVRRQPELRDEIAEDVDAYKQREADRKSKEAEKPAKDDPDPVVASPKKGKKKSAPKAPKAKKERVAKEKRITPKSITEEMLCAGKSTLEQISKRIQTECETSEERANRLVGWYRNMLVKEEKTRPHLFGKTFIENEKTGIISLRE